jgi:hypothetical protein
MSLKLIRVALMALLIPLGLGSNAWAQARIQTSENPATGHWKVMVPNSFKADTQSAVEQCKQVAKQHLTDRLIPGMCDVLEQKLKAGTCKAWNVEDGVVYDFMHGHEGGKRVVKYNTEKRLGRTDRALECDLGQGVYAHWYTGENKKSCHNLGIVFAALPKQIVAPPTPVNGACGLAAGEYRATATALRDQLCAAGTGPLSLTLPAPGNSATYPCLGTDGGRPSMCTVARASLPPLPPPEKKCDLVLRRYIVPTPGQSIFIPGLSVEACNGTVAIPAAFASIPSSVSVTSRVEEVCE